MDYIDLLKEQCPPAIVEYVISSDMTSAFKNPWPNQDFFGQNISDDCHIAALLYRSSILPSNLGDTTADYIAWDTIDYYAQVPVDDRPVVITAVRQLASRDRLPQRFFFLVTQHKIDVRDILQRHFPTLPAPENATPEHNSKSFAYLRYLTAMGDEEALTRLLEALRLEPNPAYVSNQLGQIRNLNLSQSNVIFQAFINDTRQSLTPNRMPGIVIANTVRRYLGLPPHEGPYRPLEPNGQPYIPQPDAPSSVWDR